MFAQCSLCVYLCLQENVGVGAKLSSDAFAISLRNFLATQQKSKACITRFRTLERTLKWIKVTFVVNGTNVRAEMRN